MQKILHGITAFPFYVDKLESEASGALDSSASKIVVPYVNHHVLKVNYETDVSNLFYAIPIKHRGRAE